MRPGEEQQIELTAELKDSLHRQNAERVETLRFWVANVEDAVTHEEYRQHSEECDLNFLSFK